MTVVIRAQRQEMSGPNVDMFPQVTLPARTICLERRRMKDNVFPV